MLHFHVITLFPEAMQPYLESSILGRAQKNKLIKISFYNPRDYSKDKWKRVDRRPYGGGPGMVLEAESLLRASERALKGKKNADTLFFTPSGKSFDTAWAQRLSKRQDVLLICGRYEGVDARVPKILKAKSISTGPYTLTGGEIPALAVIDAVARLVPGVLGDVNSLEHRRTTTHKAGKQEKETASSEVYTKPEILLWKKKKYRVPKVLLSGDHKKIEEWKHRKAR